MILNQLGQDISYNTYSLDMINISLFGIWILCNNSEYFLSFEDFPMFRKSSIEDLFDCKMLSANHIYWESLDIDLTLEMIENPARFPLIAKE